MNTFYQLLTKSQIDNTYKTRRKVIANYLALWTENSHLTPYMITLSPSTNTFNDTRLVRNDLMSRLRSYKNHNHKEFAYFYAIEIGKNKHSPNRQTKAEETRRLNVYQKNWHVHIQIWTDMKKSEINKVMGRIDPNLCYFSHLTTPQVQGIRYDYVIKSIDIVDFEFQYIIKTQYKKKQFQGGSRKDIPNYAITKLWWFMRSKYGKKWRKIKDRYSYVLGLKNKGELLFTTNQNAHSLGVNLNQFDKINVNRNNIVMYIKKSIL